MFLNFQNVQEVSTFKYVFNKFVPYTTFLKINLFNIYEIEFHM